MTSGNENPLHANDAVGNRVRGREKGGNHQVTPAEHG